MNERHCKLPGDSPKRSAAATLSIVSKLAHAGGRAHLIARHPQIKELPPVEGISPAAPEEIEPRLALERAVMQYHCDRDMARWSGAIQAIRALKQPWRDMPVLDLTAFRRAMRNCGIIALAWSLVGVSPEKLRRRIAITHDHAPRIADAMQRSPRNSAPPEFQQAIDQLTKNLQGSELLERIGVAVAQAALEGRDEVRRVWQITPAGRWLLATKEPCGLTPVSAEHLLISAAQNHVEGR